MPKVVITEPTVYADKIVEELKKRCEACEIIVARSREEIENVVFDADVIIVALARISCEIIEKARNLRGIVRCGTGVDNIDVDAATRKCVPVVSVPDYATNAVAEFTIALMMSLMRKVPQAHIYMRSRGYLGRPWTLRPRELLGTELKGKILGIIGFGRIGRAVAEKAKALGLSVMIYDPYLPPEIIAENSARYTFTDLKTLLMNSDIISIHCPLTRETHHLIDEEKLKLVRRTAFIINVARGPIVDEKALYKALKEGRIAGAALDVFELEPPPPNNPLFELENVILTPHIGWYTEESIDRLVSSVVDETVKILAGEMPVNVVNKEVIEYIRSGKCAVTK